MRNIRPGLTKSDRNTSSTKIYKLFALDLFKLISTTLEKNKEKGNRFSFRNLTQMDVKFRRRLGIEL